MACAIYHIVTVLQYGACKRTVAHTKKKQPVKALMIKRELEAKAINTHTKQSKRKYVVRALTTSHTQTYTEANACNVMLA